MRDSCTDVPYHIHVHVHYRLSAKTDPGFVHVDSDLSTTPLRLSRGELARFSPVTDQFPVCYTCNTRRILRSKHCTVLNRCVARFDHYCPWVSNNIGLGNQVGLAFREGQ